MCLIARLFHNLVSTLYATIGTLALMVNLALKGPFPYYKPNLLVASNHPNPTSQPEVGYLMKEDTYSYLNTLIGVGNLEAHPIIAIILNRFNKQG